MTLSRASAQLLALAAFPLLTGAAALQPARSSLAQAPAPPRTSEPAAAAATPAPAPPLPTRVFGFRDFTRQAALDAEFLAVPSRDLARQHLQALTAAPHWASSPEDYATALYVAARFKAAGLTTEIVPYSVLLPKPTSILVEAFDAAGKKILAGPTPERIAPTPGESVPSAPDPRIIAPFNSSSPAADITAPVVYANYGRRADFERLTQLGISVQGKIVLLRYGESFRGTKVYLAQQFGAKGVLLFTDPADSSTKNAQPYPAGPNPPSTAVQRGSVQFLPIYPGDPTTPGVASTPSLPASQRIPASQLQYDLPSIPVDPLSAADAAPILRALAGPVAPRDWQGGLGSPYRLGSPDAPVTVHMRLDFDVRLRTIWDVIGRIPGAALPQQLVIAGNHRDAWVYGAADPGSGTAALLEAVHGLGVLLAHGWRPRRTIVIASWDGEEEGLIGSTEWVEQHAADLAHAVAYFNIDEAASGPTFNAAAVPSLHQFLREITREVPSPAGGSAFDQWKAADRSGDARSNPALDSSVPLAAAQSPRQRLAGSPQIADLGSGSDYSPFLDHAGVPAADIGSSGPFGVYHSAFDNFDWFTRFADPTFAYTQQQARIFGLEILHMASADVLPTDELAYAEAIRIYLEQARARGIHDPRSNKLDFAPAFAAADNFLAAARSIHALQLNSTPASAAPDLQLDARLDAALIAAEHALLLSAGLPQRPWYRQAIYAPGLLTGYAAETLPGVNDALDAGDAPRAQAQLDALTAALTRAASALTLAVH